MPETDPPWRSRDFLATLPVQQLVRPEEIAAGALLLGTGTPISGQLLSRRRSDDLVADRHALVHSDDAVIAGPWPAG